MGLLRKNGTLTWQQILDLKDEIKRNGLKQFVDSYLKHKNDKNLEKLWGEEIETMIVVGDELLLCNTEFVALFNDIQEDINKNLKSTTKNNSHTKEDITKDTDDTKNRAYTREDTNKNLRSTTKNNNYINKNSSQTKEDITKDTDDTNPLNQNILFSVEFAGYMIEYCPRIPYNNELQSFINFENDLESRRKLLKKLLNDLIDGAEPLYMACYPDIKDSFYKKIDENTTCISYDSTSSLDSVNQTELKTICRQRILNKADKLTYSLTNSKSFPDNAITDHKRFTSFVQNIQNRRNKPIEGYIKIMEDAKSNEAEVLPGRIDTQKATQNVKIDSMGHGMGCCALQVTIQANDIDEARLMYDAMAIMAPLFLRLTRASPVAVGYLLNTETRWDMLNFSVDCRTDDERGCEAEYSGYMINNRIGKIKKSRCSSVDFFISNELYNDSKTFVDANYKQFLIDNGIDPLLSTHIASLFARDPVLAYSGPREDFENIQSSNWRSARLKVPGENGWRVEFRTMELQPTSFENAAFSIFVVLLFRAIAKYKLDFFIPMSKVEENFDRANLFYRDANEYYEDYLDDDKARFWYKKDGRVKEMKIDEIFNDKDGLLFYVKKYISEEYKIDEKDKDISESSHESISQPSHESLNKYLNFISKKCKNEFISVSDFIRRFIIKHPDYKNDSKINKLILKDLIKEIKKITEMNNPEYLKNKKIF